MQGTLQLKEGFLSFWYQYYGIIHNNQLILCDKKGGQKKKQIDLKTSKIQNEQNELPQFQLIADKSYRFRTDDNQKSLKWITMLRKKTENIQLSHFKKRQNSFIGKSQVNIQGLVADVWAIQAQIQQTIVLYKSKQVLSRTDAVMINKISKLAQSMKKKVTQILQNNKDQRFITQQKNQEAVFEDFQDIKQSSFVSFSLKDDFTYSKTSFKTPVIKPIKATSNSDFGLTDPIKLTLVNNNQVYKKFKDTINSASRRSNLPHKIDPNQKINLVNMFSTIITKDLTRVTMPVIINLPLSILQQISAKFANRSFLQKASKQRNSSLRLAYVVAFQFSSLFMLGNKNRKYFNPLLGQTYQLLLQNSFKLIAQQVSHHPPISALYCSCPFYNVQQTFTSNSKFRGNSVNLTNQGSYKILLKSPDVQIVITRPNISVGGLVYGESTVDISGQAKFNMSTGQQAQLNFIGAGWLSKGQKKVQGSIYDSKGKKLYLFQGVWDSYLNLINLQTQQSKKIWKMDQVIYPQQYFMTQFQKQLNYLNIDLLKKIAPTDSRLRPDQKALQLGLTDLAAEQKHRLQTKQRQRRSAYQKIQKNHQPRWFSQRGILDYVFMDQYWTMRSKGNFGDVLDIY